jgi:hypothetical protein
MLRKFMGACLVVFGLILSGNAWAITATVTGQSTGQAEKGGTFTVVKQTSTGKVTHYTGHINPTTHKVTVHVPVKKGDTLYGSLDGGLTGKPLTDDNINGTVPVDFSTGVGPIPQPGTSTYTSAPPYTPYLIVSNPLPWNGFYIGIQGSGGSTDQRIIERLTGTDTISNTLSNNKGIGSVGINGGYDFGGFGMPGATIGPNVAFNWIGNSNNQVFSNGSFIGVHYNWNVDIALKGEYWNEQHTMAIYGLAGARILDYDLQSNFTGPVLSVNRTTAGFLFGVGGEATRPEWRWGNGQWTAYAQLTIAYIDSDTVRMPPFSTSFDYTQRFTQVEATGGFRYRLWAPPPPPPP